MLEIESTHLKLQERARTKFQNESKGNLPIMDENTLRYICIENDGYETPELNDSLYAHFKGFQNIKGLDKYTNLKALWLESNGLCKIENLQMLQQLRCLYLSKNLIGKMENLSGLQSLVTLDLSENTITRIEGLSQLKNLSTLNLSRNRLESRQSIEKVLECPSITNLDLSNNAIDDNASDILEVLESLPKLRALRLTGNPMVSKTKQFRKTFLSKLTKLSYLDRPVFERERLAISAWVTGGASAERQAKEDFAKREQQEHKNCLRDFRAWQKGIREKKIQELKQRKENGENVGYFDIDADGRERTWTQHYEALSPADREAWDERSRQAKIDAQEERDQVLGNGIKQMGKSFWSEPFENSKANAEANDSTNVLLPDNQLLEIKSQTVDVENSLSDSTSEITELKEEIKSSEKIFMTNELNAPIKKNNAEEELPSNIILSSSASNRTKNESKVEEIASKVPLVDKRLVSNALGSQTPEPPKDIRGSRIESVVQRTSWDALQHQVNTDTSLCVPEILPSMDDDDEGEELRILSREDILKQLRSTSVPP